MASALQKITERVANIVTSGDYQRVQEALASVEVQLAREDFGYTKWGAASGREANDIPTADRAEIVRRSRKYFIYDPLCRQAIRLFVSYCIGRGLSIQAERDDPTAQQSTVTNTAPANLSGLPGVDSDGEDDNDPAATADAATLQQHADNFWEHPDNSVVFSLQGQHKTAEKLNIEGELFFVLFPGDDVTRVRLLMDCLEVVDVITNPEDYSEPWYYVRLSVNLDNQREYRLYPDVSLYGKQLPEITEQIQRAYRVPADAKLQDAYIHHVPVNSIGVRGYPLLTPAMDWSKVLRRFLENRATISEAHARFSFTRTVNGPASMVNNLPQGAGGGSVFGPFKPGQTYPGMAQPAGAILSTNAGEKWEPMNAQSGGQNAYEESRNFLLQFARAVGIPEHYFGDGSMGTRATATMMERPVELLFTDFQNVVKKMYERLFAFALAVAGHPYNAHAVRVDAPKILESDITKTVDAIVEILGVLPEFDIEEMRLLLLNALSMDNPQDLLDKIAQRGAELWLQAEKIAQAQSGFDPNAPEPDGTDPQAAADYYKKKSTYLGAQTPQRDPTRLPGMKRGPQFAIGRPTSSLVIRKKSPPGTRIADPLVRSHQ